MLQILTKLRSFQAHHHKLVALSLSTVLLKFVLASFGAYEKSAMLTIATCSVVFHSFARTVVDSPDALTSNEHIVVSSLAADLLNGAYTVEELGDDTILRALIALGTLVRPSPSPNAGQVPPNVLFLTSPGASRRSGGQGGGQASHEHLRGGQGGRHLFAAGRRVSGRVAVGPRPVSR